MTKEWPKLAGIHEASEIMGVSGARVGQLCEDDPAFPEPIAHLRQGRVWVAAEIAAYDLVRNKKSGRKKGWSPKAS